VPIEPFYVRAPIFLVVAALLSACATAPYQPADVDTIAFRDRAQTQSEGPVTVVAAVPDPDETRALFDLPLYDFSDGTRVETGRNFQLQAVAANRPVALIFGSYT